MGDKTGDRTGESDTAAQTRYGRQDRRQDRRGSHSIPDQMRNKTGDKRKTRPERRTHITAKAEESFENHNSELFGSNMSAEFFSHVLTCREAFLKHVRYAFM